jgi:hypothetical protein
MVVTSMQQNSVKKYFKSKESVKLSDDSDESAITRMNQMITRMNWTIL